VRRTALKRKPRRSRSAPEPDASLARRFWKSSVCRGGCVMCRAFPVARELRHELAADLRRVEGHHVIAKRHLKARGLHAHLWDTRNGLALCVYHHDRHERWMQRVPYELVPYDAFEFAAELGLDWMIPDDYPRGASDS
jgi:hypothetical protein